jgi:hypothetical protein
MRLAASLFFRCFFSGIVAALHFHFGLSYLPQTEIGDVRYPVNALCINRGNGTAFLGNRIPPLPTFGGNT